MKIVILEPIKHDGDWLAVGDIYDLSNDVAQPLIDSGSARRSDLATQTSKKDKGDK